MLLPHAGQILGMGFFRYWKEPWCAFDGVLVLLIIGEFAMEIAFQGGGLNISSVYSLLQLHFTFSPPL